MVRDRYTELQGVEMKSRYKVQGTRRPALMVFLQDFGSFLG